jgi:hypothetical protein
MPNVPVGRPTRSRYRWLLCFVSLVAACDPCAGISVCGEPAVDSEGELLFHVTGNMAEGVEVHFVRTGGVRITPDSIEAVTDANGRFRLQAAASEVGVVRGRLVFIPAEPYGFFGYDVEDVAVYTSRARGTNRFIGTWGIGPLIGTPILNYVGEFYLRGTREPLVGAEVEVQRVDGVPIEPERVIARTDASGRFHFRMDAEREGETVVDIQVQVPAPYHRFTLENVTLPVLLGRDELRFLGRWGVGEHIFYVGEVQWAHTGRPAEGIAIEFRRTGGLLIQPEVLQSTTGAGGRFVLHPTTTEPGTVIGDLFIRRGSPGTEQIIRGVQLASFEEDNPRFLGIWWIPPQ